jgi:hypothetical protein
VDNWHPVRQVFPAENQPQAIFQKRSALNAGRKFRSRDDLFEQLRQRAKIMHVSAAELAVALLKEIARDGLYDAVLDRDDAGVNCAIDKRAAVSAI